MNTNILELFEIEKKLTIQAAKENFYSFCRLIDPAFYTPDKPHLYELCETLQKIYENKLLKPDGTPYKNLILNMPPRFGKSRTLQLFVAWCLGKDQENKIMLGSYNDTLAQRFSRYTRDIIGWVKHSVFEIKFPDIFPDVHLKYGDSSVKNWAVNDQFFNYGAVGIGGSATGAGCNIQITDDPIKSVEEALNGNRLDVIWEWFSNTFATRTESNEAIQIICMTRWSTYDICGRILNESKPDEGETYGYNPDDWYVLRLEAKTDKGMTCSSVLDETKYNKLKTGMDPLIFMANYHQRPVNREGQLYSGFKTYEELPNDIEMIRAYIDTADTGEDFLCCICFAETSQKYAYVTDVYYTQSPMEVTEPQTSIILHDNNVNFAMVEGNNGGRGFARNVERELWEKYRTNEPVMYPFHQTKNKQTRIHQYSFLVQKVVIFPQNWDKKFPKFYQDIMTYQRKGKNKHDDAPDALTGVVELLEKAGKL
jgi:predicted phage terminase large subunit-like protein